MQTRQQTSNNQPALKQHLPVIAAAAAGASFVLLISSQKNMTGGEICTYSMAAAIAFSTLTLFFQHTDAILRTTNQAIEGCADTVKQGIKEFFENIYKIPKTINEKANELGNILTKAAEELANKVTNGTEEAVDTGNKTFKTYLGVGLLSLFAAAVALYEQCTTTLTISSSSQPLPPPTTSNIPPVPSPTESQMLVNAARQQPLSQPNPVTLRGTRRLFQQNVNHDSVRRFTDTPSAQNHRDVRNLTGALTHNDNSHQLSNWLKGSGMMAAGAGTYLVYGVGMSVGATLFGPAMVVAGGIAAVGAGIALDNSAKNRSPTRR